jgi:hypothetical protein
VLEEASRQAASTVTEAGGRVRQLMQQPRRPLTPVGICPQTFDLASDRFRQLLKAMDQYEQNRRGRPAADYPGH